MTVQPEHFPFYWKIRWFGNGNKWRVNEKPIEVNFLTFFSKSIFKLYSTISAVNQILFLDIYDFYKLNSFLKKKMLIRSIRNNILVDIFEVYFDVWAVDLDRFFIVNHFWLLYIAIYF